MNLLNRHRRAFLVAVCAVWTGIVAIAYWSGFAPVLQIESGASDFLVKHGRRSTVHPELVFLAINGASISLGDVFSDEIAESPALQAMKSGGWPWTRDVYGMIIDRLASAGARLIVFDMLFPSEREGDDAFREALERHRDKVIIGANFGETELSKTLSVPALSLIPSGDPLDPRVAYVNFWPDIDGTHRVAHYQITQQEVSGFEPGPDSALLYSLAGRALSLLGHEDLIPREPRFIRFAGEFNPHSFTPHPLWQIFSAQFWERPPFNRGEFFRDKVVLIGPEGNWAQDVKRTPFGAVPGPELHLHALNAALNKDFIRQPSWNANLACILAAGFLAWVLSAFIAQPLVRFIALALGSVAYYFLARFLFDQESGAVLLALTPPLFAVNGAGLIWLTCEQVIDRLEKARTRRTLERYVSKDLVKEILDNPASLLTAKGGNRRSVAILFSDLRGFTTMTEEADSRQLVAQLNEYFSEMVKAIFDSKGTLDKFIGDAVMAVWGEIQSEGPAKDVERAVTAALEMQLALTKLNRSWEQRGIRTFKMGIGINFGAVIVGEIGATGATEKMELTVIGDPVNLASRLEGLTKQYGLELLLGEGAADLVTEAFHLQFVDSVKVKGKNKPIRVYTVLGARNTPLPENVADYAACYAEGVGRYQNRDFEPAIESFTRCLKCLPEDPLASMYIGRCREFREHPPTPDWDGVFVMHEK